MQSISSPPLPPTHRLPINAQPGNGLKESEGLPLDEPVIGTEADDLAGGNVAKDAPSVQMRSNHFQGMDTQAVRSLPLVRHATAVAQPATTHPSERFTSPMPVVSRAVPRHFAHVIASAISAFMRSIGGLFPGSTATARAAAEATPVPSNAAPTAGGKPAATPQSISESYDAVRSDRSSWAKLQAECKTGEARAQLKTLEAGRDFMVSSKRYGNFARLMDVVRNHEPRMADGLRHELKAIGPESFNSKHAARLVDDMNSGMYFALQEPARRAGTPF